jgi:hypothetical protein
MGPLGFLDLLAGFTKWLRARVQERQEEWEHYVATDPAGAAVRLDMIATEARARSRSFRRQNGWRARLWRNRAIALREHAEDLRRRAVALPCKGKPERSPGT